jgi:hypothetical protein
MESPFNISDSKLVSLCLYVTTYFLKKKNVSPTAAASYFFPPLLSNSVNSKPISPLYRPVNSSFLLVLYLLMYESDKAIDILCVTCW